MYPKHPVASGRGANPKLTVITPRRLASFNFADVGNNNRSLSIKQSIVAEPVGNHSHLLLSVDVGLAISCESEGQQLTLSKLISAHLFLYSTGWQFNRFFDRLNHGLNHLISVTDVLGHDLGGKKPY